MKYVLFYELAADGLAKVAEQLPGHQRRMATFHAAEEFVKEDPFVVHGVVSTYTIQDWAEALAS